MRSYWVGVSLPSSDWGHCNKREFGDIETKGGWPHEDEGRQMMLPQAEECQGLPAAARSRESQGPEPPPRAFGRSASIFISDIWPPKVRENKAFSGSARIQ